MIPNIKYYKPKFHLSEALQYDGSLEMAQEIENLCPYCYVEWDEADVFCGLYSFQFDSTPSYVKEGTYFLKEKGSLELVDKKTFESRYELSCLEELAEECKKYVKCDSARIIEAKDKLYLILGENRTNNDNPPLLNGVPISSTWTEEKVVASGRTSEELIAETIEYARLCAITMAQYLEEIIETKK
jgi:hypothetical protein